MPEPQGEIYKRKPGISARKLDADLMLYDPDSDKVHVLNETGAMVWELMDGANTMALIEKKLKEKFTDAALETISRDLTEIVEKLKVEDLIIQEIPVNPCEQRRCG